LTDSRLTVLRFVIGEIVIHAQRKSKEKELRKVGTPDGASLWRREKGHPVGCPALAVFGDLALVAGELLELSLNQAGLVQGDQGASVDALRQFVGGRLDLMGSELRHGVVQAPEAAVLVLAVRRIIPDDLDFIHVAVSDHLGLGELVEDNVALLLLYRAFSQAAENGGAFLEALDRASHNVHKAGNVELVGVLLGEAELILKRLQAVGANEAKDAHLERDATGAVEGVVQDQAQAKVIPNLGELHQLVLEVILDVHPRTVAHGVLLAGELAQLVVRESGFDSIHQGAVLNEGVTFSANPKHLFAVGAAIGEPTRGFAIRGEERDSLDRVVEQAIGASGGSGGGDVDFGHKCSVDVKC